MYERTYENGLMLGFVTGYFQALLDESSMVSDEDEDVD